MKCPKCNFENPDDTSYCAQCGAFLLKPGEILAPTKTLQESIKDLAKGKTIAGKYKILERLGEGGMATVYLAEQTKPVRRRVAIKIIKLGMDTKQVVARFEAERQALALMDHPNIAKVYDAGATEKGRPYFVMELVHGLPITEYCDKNKLSTKERLQLFTLVCNAVQHAHQKGLIHRDLKPSNILVAIHDEKPVPKIIDFGIAKATEHRLTERTVFTEMGQLIGTPEYMSPEQAEMTGMDIDTRTDIYSLGVLLYELLIGALPFDIRELRRAGLEEIRRKIREEEPSKPSTKLSTLGDDSARIVKNRKTDVRSLAKQLKGELDWIAMKTLEKDRAKRYTTVSELASDINRHLNNEPILARPPGTFYLIRKLALRHRTLLDGIGLLLVMVVGFFLILWGPGESSVGSWKDRVFAMEREINYVKQQNKITNSFLLDMIDFYNSSKADEGKKSMETILDEWVDKVMEETKNKPRLRWRLLGFLESRARAEGLEIKKNIMITLRIMSDSGIIVDKTTSYKNDPLYKALISWAKSDFDEAKKFYSEALSLNPKKLKDEYCVRWINRYLTSIAKILRNKGDYDGAEKFYREVLTIQRILHGKDWLGDFNTLYSLATVLQEKGDIDEAKKTLDDCISIIDAIEVNIDAVEWDPKNFNIEDWEDFKLFEKFLNKVNYLEVIAGFLEVRGDYGEAEKRYLEAIEYYINFNGVETYRVFELRAYLGSLLIKMKKFDEAESLLVNSFRILKEKYHRENKYTQKALKSLIELYEGRNEPDKAEKYHKLLKEEIETP